MVFEGWVFSESSVLDPEVNLTEVCISPISNQPVNLGKFEELRSEIRRGEPYDHLRLLLSVKGQPSQIKQRSMKDPRSAGAGGENSREIGIKIKIKKKKKNISDSTILSNSILFCLFQSYAVSFLFKRSEIARF